MTDRERIVEVMATALSETSWMTVWKERAGYVLAELEAYGYAWYRRSGWEVSCPQCEEAGEVVPHDDNTDCDLCTRGQYEGHAVECPTCLGRGVVGVVPVGGEG